MGGRRARSEADALDLTLMSDLTCSRNLAAHTAFLLKASMASPDGSVHHDA